MDNKMIAIFSALVLSVGVLGTLYAQSAFAFGHGWMKTPPHTAAATPPPGNGNTHATAESHQDQGIKVSAESQQSASCNNKNNNGVSGNSC